MSYRFRQKKQKRSNSERTYSHKQQAAAMIAIAKQLEKRGFTVSALYYGNKRVHTVDAADRWLGVATFNSQTLVIGDGDVFNVDGKTPKHFPTPEDKTSQLLVDFSGQQLTLQSSAIKYMEEFFPVFAEANQMSAQEYSEELNDVAKDIAKLFFTEVNRNEQPLSKYKLKLGTADNGNVRMKVDWFADDRLSGYGKLLLVRKFSPKYKSPYYEFSGDVQRRDIEHFFATTPGLSGKLDPTPSDANQSGAAMVNLSTGEILPTSYTENPYAGNGAPQRVPSAQTVQNFGTPQQQPEQQPVQQPVQQPGQQPGQQANGQVQPQGYPNGQATHQQQQQPNGQAAQQQFQNGQLPQQQLQNGQLPQQQFQNEQLPQQQFQNEQLPQQQFQNGQLPQQQFQNGQLPQQQFQNGQLPQQQFQNGPATQQQPNGQATQQFYQNGPATQQQPNGQATQQFYQNGPVTQQQPNGQATQQQQTDPNATTPAMETYSTLVNSNVEVVDVDA